MKGWNSGFATRCWAEEGIVAGSDGLWDQLLVVEQYSVVQCVVGVPLERGPQIVTRSMGLVGAGAVECVDVVASVRQSESR